MTDEELFAEENERRKKAFDELRKLEEELGFWPYDE